MIAHLFRLVWNRRRRNGLMLAELLVSFLVLAAVASTLVHLGGRALSPLGYDHEDVWVVWLGIGSYFDMPEEERQGVRDRIRLVLREVESQDEVVAAALAQNVPFVNSRSRRGQHWEGEIVYAIDASGSLDLDRVLGMEVIAGRWFSEGDRRGETTAPVVVTRKLAETYFGDEDPIGQVLPNVDRDGTPILPTAERPGDRVIGVVEDYRWLGEYGEPHHTFFNRIDPDSERWSPTQALLLRVESGTPSSFEETLVDAMRAAAPGWNLRVQSLQELRSAQHREQLAGPVIGLVVAAFLVLTVGLGLVGVLWQSVTRRTQELAVRRALGASVGHVRLQILGEMLALATVAMMLGCLIVAQAPLLGLFPSIGLGDYLLAMALSSLFIYGLVTVCGLYPSWLATRIEPARALQYE